jgi:UrcA family protein
MNEIASISRALWLACSGLGLALGAGVAVAQQPIDVVAQAHHPEITVKRAAPNSPVHVISLARQVSYADLNPSTPAGAAELTKRINAAAEDVCKNLDAAYPETRLSGHTCTKIAVKDAMRKVRADAKAAERKGA